MDVLRTSGEWIEEINKETFPKQIIFNDKKGWETEESWNEEISIEEFEERLSKSKVMYKDLHTDEDEEGFHDHIPGRD